MPLSIAFITAGLPFDGCTTQTKSLGGSETALLCMAKEFEKRGHQVSVFCELDSKPGRYDGVDYYHHKMFPQHSVIAKWDVLIVSRWVEFLRVKNQAALRVLWLHDTLTDKNRIASALFQTDQAFLLSDFHIANYTDGDDSKIPELKKITWKTSNGVDLDLINANLVEKVPDKVIYTSRPERGLHYLLSDIFPKLIEARPTIKLHYANYDLRGLKIPDNVSYVIKLSKQLANRYPDNVVDMGHLSKDRLYQEMSSAQLLLYPTDFEEISCITAMEAQACGTVPITSDAFALKETVGDGRSGILVAGKPGSEEYNNTFVSKVLRLLNKPSLMRKYQAAGPEWIREQGFTWPQVAESWEQRFQQLLEDRLTNNQLRISMELERCNDLVAAHYFTDDPEREHYLSKKIQEAQKDPEATTENVRAAWATAMPRFGKVLHLLKERGIPPTNVLDFACGDTAFGVAVKKWAPVAEVTCVDRDPDVLSRVQLYAKKQELDLNLAEADSFEAVAKLNLGPFTCVFLGNYLDRCEDIVGTVRAALELVADGGCLALTTRHGAETATCKPEHIPKRIWNLDISDFRSLFGKASGFQATYHEEFISPGGDLCGTWIATVPKDTAKVFAIDLHKKARATRPYQTLAACLIAKDAEDDIVRCLKAIHPICDSIHLTLDSRTSDATAALATPYLTELRTHDFEDFSRQRNFSKSEVDADWILWLDTDEVMTDAPKLRQYLTGPFFDGFGLKQCHLMLDVHGTFDVPIRVFRNHPHYQFVGCIHEHCEDLSKGPYDNPINPTVLIDDVSLAHYGYQDERQRRVKCSNRNMSLLLKDIEENGKKGRMLTWVLAIRDYLNIIKWHLHSNRNSPITNGSQYHHMLNAAVSTYLHFFQNPKQKYHLLVSPLYQEALKVLGIAGLPYRDRKFPPFEVAFTLAGRIGGLQTENFKPNKLWFVDHQQYFEHVKEQAVTLAVASGLAPREDFEKDLHKLTWEHDEKAFELLTAGVNVIDELTGFSQLQ